MPGRVSTRASTASRSPRKSALPATASHPPAPHRVSASPAAPGEGETTALRTEVCKIFSEVQRSTASHRKLVVTLRKLQEACCYEPTKPSAAKNFDSFEEEDFNREISRCLVRVLPVKKAEDVGDRVIRFLGQFLKHANGKDLALVSSEETEENETLPDTPSSRLTSHILSTLLPILVAKEKTVRYRSTQIISHIVNSLDSIDDEYYHLIRVGLLKRLKDKEPMVRVQAVLGLGRLAGNEGVEEDEDNDSDDDDATGLLEKLLDALQNDPSADVRRSLLLNLPLSPTTLPFLLERARDLDAATRRALYSRLLPSLGDFRHLSLSMREKILRWGLQDRDANVRKATGRLFHERWIEDCAGSHATESEEKPEANIDALLELLERIDILNAGIEDGIAQEAMKGFWTGRGDYLAAVAFDDTYWDTLTSEKAFLARSLNDYRIHAKDSMIDSIVEEKMPEVTKLAFFIQKYTNVLIAQLQNAAAASADGESEEGLAELEFVVEQLLHIALTLDYTDEIGRRKMFSLLRETLALPELPEGITKLVVEILRLICGTDSAAEREFCGVVLEAVAEVHDTIAPEMPSMMDEDESFHSAKSEVGTENGSNRTGASKEPMTEAEEAQEEEKAIKEILVNMKCLHIAQCMLQNVEENLQENIHLVTMLNNLVVPAVRSHEAPIRERGLYCLGLCCLLDKTLAEENLTLFFHCFNKGHPTLQTTALQILCDMLMTHPSLLSATPTDTASTQKQIFKVFSKGLKLAHEPEVQSAATTSLCKLMLTRYVVDADLLRQLVVSFFEPATQENAAVRQALSYFLPMFAHSRQENMELLATVVPAVVHAFVGMGEELEEDEEMVGLTAFGGMLVDWTDPRKLVILDAATSTWDEAGKKENKAISADVHLGLAAGLLEKALGHACPKEEKRVLLGMLGKLYVSPSSASEKLETAAQLAEEAIDHKVASDATSRNALTKFHTAVTKAMANENPGSPRKSMAPVLLAGIEDSPENPEAEAVVEDSGKIVKTQFDEGRSQIDGEESILNELLEEDTELGDDTL